MYSLFDISQCVGVKWRASRAGQQLIRRPLEWQTDTSDKLYLFSNYEKKHFHCHCHGNSFGDAKSPPAIRLLPPSSDAADRSELLLATPHSSNNREEVLVQDAAAATFGATLAEGSPFETTGSSAVVDDKPLMDNGRTARSAAENSDKGINWEESPKVATPTQMTTVRSKWDPTFLADIVGTVSKFWKIAN